MQDDLGVNPAKQFTDPVLTEAYARAKRCIEWRSNADENMLSDYKMRHGDDINQYQWPNSIRRMRDGDGKPCLTLNVIRQHNLMIVNEGRQGKSAMTVRPTGNGATVESAQMFNSVLKHIERISAAQTAYTQARQFQIDCGLGWLRLYTDYASADTFDQEIYIGGVNDPLSVHIDPDIKRFDGLDAQFGFVFDKVLRKEFFSAYPKFRELIGDLPMGLGPTDWVGTDYIRVAEYFRIVNKKDELLSIQHDDGRRVTVRKSFLHPSMHDEIIARPGTCRRDVWDDICEWKLIAGDRIVDETIWPSRYVPLVRCVGEETVIDGEYDCKGHTRAMRDAQRMYNFNAALSVNTKIPTPNGWTTMGELQTGDWIFDQSGKPVQIKEALAIRYGEPCFKITFDNGHTVITDAGHIWKVEERGKRTSASWTWSNKTVSTVELTAKKHFIKTAGSLQLDECQLPIDPYTLGVWLGDGTSATAQITAHVDDVEEQKGLIRECGYEVGNTLWNEGLGVSFNINGLRKQLRDAGLTNNKHVPAKYFRASREQRLALLQGLMDTDGHFNSAINLCMFTNGNKKLAWAVMELVTSLGMKPRVTRNAAQVKLFPNGKEYISRETFLVHFTADPDIPIFRLTRKAILQTANRPTHWRRTKRFGIVSVEPVTSVPVRCIMLDTPEHLYLCSEGMIPTHNSSQVETVAMQGKTPWVAPAAAIEELEAYWNTANKVNHSVLPYNHIDDEGNVIPAPVRQEPPKESPAFEAGMTTAFNQMMMTSGQWQNQMGMGGNERTGDAISRRQSQSETATFHFGDNFEITLQTLCKQIIDVFPKVYDTKRTLYIVDDRGVDQEVELDPGARQSYLQTIAHDGEVVKRLFNPTLGTYDIADGSQPDTGTQRQESQKAFMLLLTQGKEMAPYIADLLMDTFDFQGAQEAAQRLRRMVPPQAMGKGPSAQEQQMGEEIAGLKQALATALTSNAKDKLKLVGKAEMRDIDAYEAETKRMAALKDLASDPEFQQVVQQLINDALVTHITTIQSANADELAAETPPAPPPAQPQLEAPAQ